MGGTEYNMSANLAFFRSKQQIRTLPGPWSGWEHSFKGVRR